MTDKNRKSYLGKGSSMFIMLCLCVSNKVLIGTSYYSPEVVGCYPLLAGYEGNTRNKIVKVSFLYSTFISMPRTVC